MKIKSLIEQIKLDSECIVYPASGLPTIEEGCILPNDIKEFYSMCGGLSLYRDNDYAINILPPERFVLANPVIVGERCEEDISSNWYIFADDGSGEYLTIDLSPSRVGRCYDSFFDRHGVVGSCPIIAMSFTDAINRLYENKGQYWYWLNDDFQSLGDAYDVIS